MTVTLEDMTILPNVGPHLRYPFDLLPGGWLLVEGPDELRYGLVDALLEAAPLPTSPRTACA